MIPFDEMWMRLKKLVKPNGAIVLFGSQPFTSALVMSNPRWFKYCWTWDKVNKFAGHLNAKKQPLKITEDVLVFGQGQTNYYPCMKKGKSYTAISKGNKSSIFGDQSDNVKTINIGLFYPKNIVSIKGDERASSGRLHPTQKPVALMEYLIKTYTLPNETVLDFTMGSGSTGVAAKKLGRKFIGIELDTDYFEIAKNRINEVWAPGQTEPSDKKPIAEKEQLDIWDALAS